MTFRSTGRRLAAVALVFALAGPAPALDPKAVEDEIRARKLAGAVGELHMLQAPPGRFAAWMDGAKAGDPGCQWLVGRSYQYGFTVPKDPAKAAEWFKKAVDQGYARAQLSYGRMLAAGTGVPKDLDEAVRLYRKAADQPDCPEAYEWLIQAYNRGFSVPKDPAKAKELAPKAVAAYEKLADKGYAGAQMRLARILTTGTWGTPVDVKKGLALYEKGLAQGHIYCQTNMGEAYATGKYGLPKDLARGAKLYAMAAAQGDPIATTSLVEMVLDGEVPTPDAAEKLYAAAAKAFKADADKNDAGAAYRLAQMTEKGAGVPKDDAAAVALYKKAAAAGSAPAALALADRYDAGRGVPKDPAEAAKLRDKATSAVGKKPGEVMLRPATVTPAGATAKVDYEQGMMFVPENRADPKSRLIRVGFARFKATKPTTAPPVFYLPGGPGQSYLTDVSRSFRGFDPYRAVADVVVVDQRGFSPRGDTLSFKYNFPGDPLDKPSDMAKDTADFVDLAKAAVADAKAKGVDLRGYTAPECADDVNDLRKALGYDKITLCGTSFGSQWSFTTMRRHPGIVARALLSGVEPLDCGYDMPSHVFAAVQRMWWEAEKDPHVKPLLPPGGLTAAAREVSKRLDREPARVAVKDPMTGQDVTVTLGKADFQRDFLRLAEPASLLAVYQGKYADWAKPIPNRRRAREVTTHLLGPLIDTGLGVTPQREFLLRTDPGSEFLGHWNFDDYLATADIWPTADAGDEFRTEVVCPIPVVFAQGDWDTSTPVENLLAVVPYFPNGRVLIAEHGGHGVLGPIHRALPDVGAKLLDFVRTGDLAGIPPRVSLPVPKSRAPGVESGN